MSLAQKIIDVDSRWIWLFMIFAYALPVLVPLGIPVSVGEQTTIIYNRIEGLEDGDVIFFDMAGMVYILPSFEAPTTAFLKHVFSKPVKLVIYATVPDGIPVYEILMKEVKPENLGKVYGEDYVFLGYVAGGETAMASIITDTWGTTPADHYGTSLENLPIMADVHDYNDIDLMMAIATGLPDDRIRTYTVKGGLVWGMISTGGSTPLVMPYIKAGQMLCVLDGVIAGAEYEQLLNYVGKGLKRADMVSTVHSYFLILVVLSNISYAILKSKEGGRV